jgi:KipI family sensor histidine kinase inhibitor
MSRPPPAVYPLGEAAWTVVLGEQVDAATHAAVLRLAKRVTRRGWPGVGEIVPGYAALTVCFDPAAADPDRLRDFLAETAQQLEGADSGPAPTGGLHRLPVRYDGPDLAWVAQHTGLDPAEVARRHAAREYRVFLLGFAPGFAYLGELDPTLVVPRRPSPRTRVPPGSVAIAGAQTAVYPLATPGGWQLIGSTAVRMFDPDRDPPALLRPGDRVRFEPVP